MQRSVQNRNALLLEGRKLRSHFVSNELIYRAEFNDVDFKVPITGRDWLSEYKTGRLWIELHFVPITDIHCYLSAKIQVFERPLVGRYAKDSQFHFRRFHGKGSVLVNGYEPVKNPERMGLEPVPSLVRLKRFDNGQCGWENVSDLIFRKVSLGANGKTCLPSRASNMEARKTPRELIKTRTKAINKIAHKKGNIHRERFALDAYNMLLLSRIILSGDEVRFGFESGADYRVDFVQVISRPINLKF